MERPRNLQEQRGGRLATYAVIGALALSGCSGQDRSNYLVEVPDLPGCDLPPHQILDEGDSNQRRITQNGSRNPIQKNDVVALNFNETRQQLEGFREVHRSEVEEYGITLTVYSNGELMVDDAALVETFKMPFAVDFEIPRLNATMECIEEAFVAGEFSGHEIRSYISADPRDCINSLQLSPRGVTPSGHRGECHATGGSMPWRIKEVSMLQDIVQLQPAVSPVIVAPGAVSASEYPEELFDLDPTHPDYPRVTSDPNRRMLSIWIHEIVHTKRWMNGASYSLLNPNIEEDLVKHIDRATMTHINQLEDYQPALSYSEEQVADWSDSEIS